MFFEEMVTCYSENWFCVLKRFEMAGSEGHGVYTFEGQQCNLSYVTCDTT